MFYCFGCGSGGNLIDFVKKIENLDFVDTVRFLADRAGVTLEEEIYSPAVQKKHDERERILKMNKLAAKRYVANFSAEDAKGVRDYAAGRGLTRDIVTTYGIGFAIAKGLAIAEIMISQGVAIAKAVEAATKSGGTWWTVAATIATAVATVTATISSALKSVNSAKIGGSGSAGGSGASSMTYTSSAMYNPMLAQLNGVGDNMMPYESRMRDESMNEEMMTDAVTRGVQNQPAPVVSVVEITETQNRVKAIESMGDV